MYICNLKLFPFNWAWSIYQDAKRNQHSLSADYFWFRESMKCRPLIIWILVLQRVNGCKKALTMGPIGHSKGIPRQCGNRSDTTWWPTLEPSNASDMTWQPGGKICNWCKWCHLVAKFETNASGAIWWPICQFMQLMQVAPSCGQFFNSCKWCHQIWN